MKPGRYPIIVRNTQPQDFDPIIDLCKRVYPNAPPWGRDQLASHLRLFPEGQFVAVEQTEQGERVVGMAASLIVKWADYDMNVNWRDITAAGTFTNHDPEEGRTLYAAEVMVDPDQQGRGIGKMIYKARRDVTRRLGLLRIRAGARLRGYEKYAGQITPQEYVRKVIAKEIGDPTLSFQLKQGFRVIGVVENYLPNDPASRGHAAVIEWINHQVAQPRDYRQRDPAYGRKRKPKQDDSV